MWKLELDGNDIVSWKDTTIQKGKDWSFIIDDYSTSLSLDILLLVSNRTVWVVMSFRDSVCPASLLFAFDVDFNVLGI